MADLTCPRCHAGYPRWRVVFSPPTFRCLSCGPRRLARWLARPEPCYIPSRRPLSRQVVRLHEENQGIVSTELRDVLVSILVAGGFSVGLIGAVFYFFPAMIDRSKVVARRA